MSDSIDTEEYFDVGDRLNSTRADSAEGTEFQDTVPSLSTDVERSLASNSDDISEIISVRSDAGGGVFNSSRLLSKSISLKKHQVVVQKLRAEIALLGDSLAKTDLVDIQTLQTKLRTNMLDLKRLKELNFELKNRVQVLETRLHEALQRELILRDEIKSLKSDNSELIFSDPITETFLYDASSSVSLSGVTMNTTTQDYQKPHLADVDINEPTIVPSSASIQHTTSEEFSGDEENSKTKFCPSLTHKALQRRCQHLERLSVSYQERIKYLEVFHYPD
jgi:hypothetical protein